MGIGAAFAIGLINGFTNNIQEEKARRQANKASLDDLRTSMIEAYSDDKVELGDAISDIIEGGEEQIAGRGRVDLFGRPSAEMDLDFTKLRDTVNSVGTYGLTFGSGANKIQFLKNQEYDGSSDQLGMLFDEAAAFFTDPTYQDKFRNMNALERNKLVTYVTSARRNVRTKLAGDKDLDIDVGQKEDTLFPGLFWLDQNASRLGAVPEGHTPAANISPVQLEEITDAQLEFNQRNPTASNQGTVIVGMAGTPDDDYDVEDGRFMILDDIAYANLTTIAQKFNTRPEDFFYVWQNSITNDLGMTRQNSKDLLLASLDVGKQIRNVGRLDPDDTQLRLPANETNLLNALTKLKNLVGNDAQKMAYILAPYMSYDGPVQTEVGYGEVRKVKNESIQQYILRKMYGDKAKDVNFADFDEQAEAIIRTDDLLKNFRAELEQRRDRKEGTELAGQILLNLEGLFNLEQGTVVSLITQTAGSIADALNVGKKANSLRYDVSMVGTGETDEDLIVTNQDDYTEEYDQILKRRIADAGDNNAARLESMRITLAFEMARAADPSGRLSNQDIELQYLKLGKAGRLPSDAIAALEVVQEEFRKRRDKVELLQALGSSNRQGRTRDFLVIDGLITADYLLRNEESFKVSTGQRKEKVSAPTFYSSDEYEFKQHDVFTYDRGTGNTGPVFMIRPKGSTGSAMMVGGKVVYVDSLGYVVPEDQIVRQ